MNKKDRQELQKRFLELCQKFNGDVQNIITIKVIDDGVEEDSYYEEPSVELNLNSSGKEPNGEFIVTFGFASEQDDFRFKLRVVLTPDRYQTVYVVIEHLLFEKVYYEEVVKWIKKPEELKGIQGKIEIPDEDIPEEILEIYYTINL